MIQPAKTASGRATRMAIHCHSGMERARCLVREEGSLVSILGKPVPVPCGVSRPSGSDRVGAAGAAGADLAADLEVRPGICAVQAGVGNRNIANRMVRSLTMHAPDRLDEPRFNDGFGMACGASAQAGATEENALVAN